MHNVRVYVYVCVSHMVHCRLPPTLTNYYLMSRLNLKSHIQLLTVEPQSEAVYYYITSICIVLSEEVMSKLETFAQC